MDVIPSIIKLFEHGSLAPEHFECLVANGIKFKETSYLGTPSYLGIKPDGCASYYIGADWLHEEKSKALMVLPKMNNIDFIEMYVRSLNFDIANSYFSKIYHIDFDKKEIETDVLTDQLTPLLIFHFLNVAKRIVKRGLKQDYVSKEENLQSKIKGRIKIARNDRMNSIPKRYDRIFCEYNDYVTDTPENRLLKKALLFSKKYLYQIQTHKSYSIVNKQVNELLSNFELVSDDIELHEVRKVYQHKIYNDYNEGLNLAKTILRRFSYSIQNVNNTYNKIAPFWIDMARLYEVYVYSLLYEKYGDDIQFQVKGSCGTAVDFIKRSENLIIDTKYKPQYNDSNKGIINDVRQISGYARDNKILKALGVEDDVIVPCLIIYPEKVSSTDKQVRCFSEEKIFNDEDALKIKGFRQFYKMSVSLPLLSE